MKCQTRKRHGPNPLLKKEEAKPSNQTAYKNSFFTCSHPYALYSSLSLCLSLKSHPFMAASSLLSLMFLIPTLLLASSSLSVAPNSTTFTIHLSPIPLIFPKTQVPIKNLNPLAYSHSISLNFGTPPQNISFILDTGSSAVWFPCTSNYVCTGCSIYPFKISLFIPERSSSSKLIHCQNPNCARISSSNFSPDCQGACRYSLLYGIGNSSGRLLSETLDFPEKLFTNFLVGCSNTVMTQRPTGIAGFGRTPASLPSQLGLSKFSYCLTSRWFDNTSESSVLVLYRGSSSDAKTPGLSYTPFRKNPALLEYYYVDLLKVIVGSKSVNISPNYLVPDDEGYGGTIVDSGSTFTYMEEPILDAVILAFKAEMVNFSRASAVVGPLFGMKLCFNITGLKFEKIKFPELTFEFEGGAKMELPVANYFQPFGVGYSSVACLTIISKDGLNQLPPAIILGNTQQQNFYLEFDLKNDRFGFRKQTWNKK